MKEIHFDSIDSTSLYLKNNYHNLDNLTIVSSKTQTNGRGRNNRRWLDDSNNLLFSILIKDDYLFKSYKALSVISAYTITKVLEKYNIHNVSIKWPNDVYVNDNKICGILLEGASKEELECLIIGVGLNVNQVVFDGDYIVKPISMKNILNIDIDIDILKKNIFNELSVNLNNLLANHNFYEEIVKYDYLKDRDVYSLINNEKRLVKVIGIDSDYSLKIIDNHKEINIEAGEISFHL